MDEKEQSEDKDEKLSRSDRIALRVSVVQTILAVTGLFIGTIALYAALTEADAVRKQQQASVWPHLQFQEMNYGKLGEEKFEFSIQNRGIGPARVGYISVTTDGEEQQDWFDVIRAVSDEGQPAISNAAIAGSVISAEQDIELVSVERTYADLATIQSLRSAFSDDRIVVDVCYCSVFDKCWNVSTTSDRAQSVDHCPAQTDDTAF